MRYKSFISTLAIALVSGACSFKPALDRLALPVAANFPGATEGVVPADIAWQKFFTDPRLKQLVETALANNRDLRIATLKVEQSRAQYGVSRSELFPSISGTAASNRQRNLGSGSSSSVTKTNNHALTVGFSSYELDLFGRVRSQNDSALEKYFASDEARVGAQISLVAEVANQYLVERALQQQVVLSQQTLEGINAAYGLMKQRFDAGTVSELDLSSTEVQRQTAKADLAAFQQRIALINNSLTFLTAGALPVNLPPGRTLDQVIVADIKAGVSSDLLRRRPDIREAEHQLRAANANIGEARAAFFPSVTLTANGGMASRNFSNLFNDSTGTWLFAPNVNLPIFTGGRNKANLDASKIGKDIEIARYESAIQNGFREVADGLATRSGLAEQIAATVGLVAAQQKRAELANVRYDQGMDSYFEVLTASLDLYSARQDLIQLRLAQAVNSVSLYKALGGGW